MNPKTVDVPVLIVGAGPAGLVTAISLSRFGIKSMLVEKHPGVSIYPRANAISTRSMEIFRQFGIEDSIRAIARESAPRIAFRNALVGPLLQEIPVGFPTPEEAAVFSPSRPAILTQDYLEPILLEELRRLGKCDIRFATEMTSVEQDDGGVTARIRDCASGEETTVRAQYVVGADGTRSKVRESNGIGLVGMPEHSTWHLAIFEAPGLRAMLSDSLYVLTVINGFENEALMVFAENDRWIFAMLVMPEEADSMPRDEALVDAIRRATGVPDLNVTVTSTHDFVMAGLVAEQFRAGRAFLAGDSAHRMTPMGGQGMNTAIQDGHNLAWKLAYVLRGWAGPDLLDTYEPERRPIGERNTRRSIGDEEERRPDGLDIDLGYRYASSAVMGDGVEVPPVDVPSEALPGARLPHFWLNAAGRRISSVDMYADKLTLIVGPNGRGWSEAASEVADENELPLEVSVVGGCSLNAENEAWMSNLGLRQAGAVLVRPDGFVAWRSVCGWAYPTAEMRSVLKQVLSLK